jgi:hypothetical protein
MSNGKQQLLDLGPDARDSAASNRLRKIVATRDAHAPVLTRRNQVAKPQHGRGLAV